jgi:hypothetical protein
MPSSSRSIAGETLVAEDLYDSARRRILNRKALPGYNFDLTRGDSEGYAVDAGADRQADCSNRAE